MVWVPRHEDIIGTFIFFLITGFAVMQMMIGYRRTHGLSFYGAAIRPAVNYIVGGLLLVGGFAWYFSNPANRSAPGIEGFMSLVCMALGFIFAALLTAVLPTLAYWLRRRGGAAASPAGIASIYKGPEGELALTGAVSPGPEGRFAVLVCDRDGITRLASRLAGELAASGQPVALVAPSYFCAPAPDAGNGVCDAFITLLDRLVEATGGGQRELDVAGLGLGADLASRIPAEGRGWRTHRVVLLNPQPEQGAAVGALQTVTPGDIAAIAWRERIWASARMRRIWSIAAGIALILVVVGVTAAGIVGVRWWPVAGTLAGLLVSAWVGYVYLAWRHPELLKGGYDKILESVRSEMRSRPYAAVPVPRHVRFAPRLASRSLESELRELLTGPD